MISRGKLRQALSRYVSDTFTDLNTVEEFIHNHEKWTKDRESEHQEMDEIKTRNKRRIDPEGASKAILNVMKDKFTPGKVETEECDLEFKLFNILKRTLKGLQPLQKFLEAVEKLSVTSVHVFQPNNVLNMTEENLRGVKEIISICVNICPLLLLFKRDNETFFSPRLQNIDALQHQLNAYIINVNTICHQFKRCLLLRFVNPRIYLNVDLSEDDMRKMLSHINKLQELRMDEDFRTVFLFQGKHEDFLKEYSERRPHMEQFLSEVEQCATELDNMKKGKKISGVVSGSLGVTGGVLAIVGTALLPVTLGASSVLIGTGVGMAAASGGTSIATLVADRKVNKRQTGKANEAFEKFKNDINALQRCLYTISNIKLGGDVLKLGSAFPKGTQAATQIGRAAVSGAKAVTKVARVGFVAVNALFIGFDVATIALNSRDLYKGKEADSAKLIRAKAALWRCEVQSWEKIYQSLEQGLQSSQGKQNILETLFY